jgi:hypothetical protein
MRHEKSFYKRGVRLHGGPHRVEPDRRLTREHTPPPPELPVADMAAIKQRMDQAQRLLDEYQALARTYRLPR